MAHLFQPILHNMPMPGCNTIDSRVDACVVKDTNGRRPLLKVRPSIRGSIFRALFCQDINYETCSTRLLHSLGNEVMYSYKNDIIKNSHVDCYERPPLATFDGGETEPSNDSPSSAPVRVSHSGLAPGGRRRRTTL